MSQSSDAQSMQYSDSEMADLHQQVLKKRSLGFVEEDQLLPLYNYLGNLKMQYLEEEKYLEARDANELMENCKEEIQFRNEDKNDEQNRDSSENSTAGRKKSEYDKKIQEHDEQTKVKIQNMNQKHSEELENFEKEWREVMPEKYRRPSKRLIDLRQTAHNLAYAGKFEEANERKIEANNLMQEEHEQAKHKLDHDYQEAKKKIVKKHKDELALLQQTCQQQRELLVSKKQATEQALANRMIVLGSKPTNKSRTSSKISPMQTQPVQSRGTRKSSTFNSDQRLPPLEPPNSGTASSTQKRTQAKPLNQSNTSEQQASSKSSVSTQKSSGSSSPKPLSPKPEDNDEDNKADNPSEPQPGMLEDTLMAKAAEMVDNAGGTTPNDEENEQKPEQEDEANNNQ